MGDLSMTGPINMTQVGSKFIQLLVDQLENEQLRNTKSNELPRVHHELRVELWTAILQQQAAPSRGLFVQPHGRISQEGIDANQAGFRCRELQ